MSKDESREAVYGMPYETWKATYQGIGQPRATRGDEKGPERALIVIVVIPGRCQASNPASRAFPDAQLRI